VRSARAGALALVLGLGALAGAGPVRAQEPWWDKDDARAEARRTITRVQELMATTERGDPRPAAAALTDASWVVRLVAAIRLGVLGLDEPTVATLREAADPTRPAPAADWKPVQQARAFADALEVELGPPVEITPRQAIQIAAAVLTERVHELPAEDPLAKRRMVESLLAWRAAAPEAGDRAWLARRLLGLTDLEQAVKDLGARPDRIAGEDGAKVFDWYAENAPYLFWQPGERRLRVDVEARQQHQPTAEYRRAHPWGPQEGPNAPARPGQGER
jgi:hypothetical protein